MKNQVLMKAETEIDKLIMGSEIVESCEIWLIIQSNLLKLNFVKAGLLVDEKVMSSPLKTEFKKRIDKGAFYFNTIHDTINQKFNDCVVIREMNYLHLIVDLQLKTFGKTIEICFKVKSERLMFVSKHEFLAKSMLDDCLENLDIAKFFSVLKFQFPVLEFLYNLQNGLLDEWDIYDKIENKQLISIIPLTIDEYVITLNFKNFLPEAQAAKNTKSYINKLNVKLSLDSEHVVIVFEKSNTIIFEILYHKIHQFFGDRIKRSDEIFAIKFISVEEVKVYFESILTFFMSYNQILLIYNFVRYKYKKELEGGSNKIIKPEIVVVLKNNINTNILLKTCYFSVHIARKQTKMSFEPIIELRNNIKIDNDIILSLYNNSAYNIYETFGVFYCCLVELESHTEISQNIKNFVESYDQIAIENKPQTMIKLNFFTLFHLIQEDKSVNSFYFKIIIYDSKNYLKGKIINTGTAWRFVMSHIKQISHPTLKQVISKIASTSLKDLYRYITG